jgi:transcriptional regulator with XRE-family HTH domain
VAEMNLKRIGSKVRDLREQAGHTQERFAEMAGISTRGLQKFEYGEGNPELRTVDAIAKALGLEISQLLTPKLDAFDTPWQITEFLAQRKVTPLNRAQIEALILLFSKAKPHQRAAVLFLLSDDESLLHNFPELGPILSAVLSKG